MATRANWKGFLKVGEVSCGVALYSATSTSERIAFHTLNRKTGNRIQRRFVDSENGKLVEPDDQVKGYEIGSGEYVVLEPKEVAAAIPESDKTLNVSAFISCDAIDDIYLDKPYYLAPYDEAGHEAFILLREGMRSSKVAALTQTVLFRRVRPILIRPDGNGMIATTLNFDYEVRSAEDAFESVPDSKIEGEMLDLAKHIISSKTGEFDPSAFDDRYESALADMVKAKLEGRKIELQPERKSAKVIDLMQALRESAGATAKRPASRKTAKATSAKTRKVS